MQTSFIAVSTTFKITLSARNFVEYITELYTTSYFSARMYVPEASST